MDIEILHADHGIGPSHKAVIASLFAEALDGILIKTVDLPADCEDLMSGIHGPIVGDMPVFAHEVRWAHRGDRPGLSRVCDRPERPTRQMTVIGKKEGDTVTVFTAYGGPLAPREITDPSLPPEAAEEAAQFWSAHALTAPAEDGPGSPPCACKRTLFFGGKVSGGQGYATWPNGVEEDDVPSLKGISEHDYIGCMVCIDCHKVVGMPSAEEILAKQPEAPCTLR